MRHFKLMINSNCQFFRYISCDCEPSCEEVTVNVIASNERAAKGDSISEICPSGTFNDITESTPNLDLSERLFGNRKW